MKDKLEPRESPKPSLIGRLIESQAQPGVRYQIERLVGAGGMGSAYLARRDAPEGSSAVVVKVVNPNLGQRLPPEILAMKEAVALGRLNQRVPPTPFVVRFVDAGSAPFFGPSLTPWTAIEYVHGGVEGTSLEDRVTYSVHKTGYAFEPLRAAHAVRCLSVGLTAIHDVGVIHRDLSPGNVLCCGFGASEIFKIADFGISRATGVEPTFQGVILGTLGYSAPESALSAAGPASDLFSLAALVYYLLTGQHYFDASSPIEAMQRFMSKTRASIAENAALAPELLDRPEACRQIDLALARATAISISERPQNAAQFAATLLPWLGETNSGPRSSGRLLTAMRGAPDSVSARELTWIIKSQASEDRLITSAAWDTAGHAFVVSVKGVHFWNGHAFLDARRLLKDVPGEPSFVQRYDAGGWLLGGRSSVLVVVDANGIRERIEAQHSDTRFELANGRIDDLLVATGARPGQPPTLFAMCGRRWLKPLPLPDAAAILTLHRLDDERWLLGGRLREGGGFSAVYSPLQAEVSMLEMPRVRSIIGGASLPERGTALLVGSQGLTLQFDGEQRSISMVPDAPDLSAAALDILTREWAASLGVLWSRDARKGEAWQVAWLAPGWKAPFVSLMADAGIVMAMTADGAVVEGRADSAHVQAERRSDR
jgi:serine/threonine protein kinase